MMIMLTAPIKMMTDYRGYLKLCWKMLKHLLRHVLLAAIRVSAEELEMVQLLTQTTHILNHA